MVEIPDAEVELSHSDEKKITLETKKLINEIKALIDDQSPDKLKKLQEKIFKVYSEQNSIEWAMRNCKSRITIYKGDVSSLTQQFDAQNKKKTLLENLCKDMQNKNLELYEENKSIKLKEEKIRKELQKKMKNQAKEATDRIEKKSNNYQILMKENEHYQKCLNEIIPKLEEKRKAIKQNVAENTNNMQNLFQDVHQKLMNEIASITSSSGKTKNECEKLKDEETMVKIEFENAKAQFELAKQKIDFYYPKFGSLKQQIEEKAKKYLELSEDKKVLADYPNAQSKGMLDQLKKEMESNKKKKDVLVNLKNELSKLAQVQS